MDKKYDNTEKGVRAFIKEQTSLILTEESKITPTDEFVKGVWKITRLAALDVAITRYDIIITMAGYPDHLERMREFNHIEEFENKE